VLVSNVGYDVAAAAMGLIHWASWRRVRPMLSMTILSMKARSGEVAVDQA
jgi:hypothetical protein